MAQARRMLRRFIPQPSSEAIRQAIERLLERLPPVTLGKMLIWVGGVALLVSSALLMYLVGVLLARLVVWSFLEQPRPSLCPYAPKCLERGFSEVCIQN
jgi:hypothetical protein